jgi:transcriptional regulator with XRE-family HTH domain
MAEHGTLTMRVEGCKCPPCKKAGTEWDRNRRQQIAYGRWQPYVPAEPARRHVRELMEFGIGFRQIAKLSGVSMTAVGMLVFGEPGRGLPPSRKVRPETERRLLAVTKTVDNIDKWVDAAGSRRRLQALATAGWSMKGLAARAGFNEGTFGQISSGRRTQVAVPTARIIARLYDELWNQTPPASNKHERQALQLTKGLAKRRGWLSPLAWDDDLIDLPDDELEVELARGVALMDYRELQRCADSCYRLGDQSPLIVAGAREYERRKKRKEPAA